MRRSTLVTSMLALVLGSASLALAAGAGHPSPEQTLQLRIIQFLGFGIVFAILLIFAFPVVGRLLRQRSEKVAHDFTAIEEGRKRAVEEREAAERALKDFERTTTEALERATKEGAALRERLVEEADVQAARIAKKGKLEAEIERAKAKLELQNTFARVAFDAAGEVLATAIDRASHDALVDRFLDDLGAMKVQA